MNLETLHTDIAESLRERGHTDTDIQSMTPEQVFDEYCEWHGLCRWGSDLRRVMGNASEANS